MRSWVSFAVAALACAVGVSGGGLKYDFAYNGPEKLHAYTNEALMDRVCCFAHVVVAAHCRCSIEDSP
jgi:hypothetical protein